MEMTELWKANIRLSTSPWESRRRREIPTFPQLRRRVVLLERKRTQKEKTEGRLHKTLDTAWKRGSVRYAELTRRGVRKDLAVRTVKSPHGPWYLAATPGLAFALPNAYFTSLGIPQLFRTR
jgi:RNA-directed DNA polymerase